MLRSPNRPSSAAPDVCDALLASVRRVATRARRLLRIRAIAWATAAVGLASMGAATIDWVTRTPPQWFRWALSVALLAVVVTVLLRLVWPAITVRLSLVQAARRIERAFPSLDDRLSSVVALSPAVQPEPAAAASAGLVRQAAVQIGRDVTLLDLREAIDVRPTRRAVAVAVTTLVLGALAAVAWPASAGLAAKRVAMPWIEAPWPRQHVLQLAPLPAAIHAGVPVPITVADRRGALPADATLLMRSGSDRRPRPLPAHRQRSGQEWLLVGAVQAPPTDAEILIRAVGGDDRAMPWHRMAVIQPPRLTAQRFVVTPPSYTGLPTYETTDKDFTAPSGSRLEFRASLDRPLQSAELRTTVSRPSGADDQQAGRPPAQRVALQLDRGGTAISGQVPPPPRAGDLRIVLHWTDRQAISGRAESGWTIRVTPDVPPRSQWIQPRSSLDVTMDAVVPLAWETTDDYGLTSSGVQVASGQTPENRPRETEILFRWNNDSPLAGAAEPVLQQRRDASLPLAAVDGIGPGSWIELRVVASDARPQPGISPALRLNVVDEATVRSRLVKDSQHVLQQIRQARRDQQIALEKTAEAAGRVGDAPAQAQAAADLTRLAHSVQQQAANHIDAGPSAALQTARDAVEMARINGLNTSSIDALRRAVDRLESIRDRFLQPAGQRLREATSASPPVDAAAQRATLDQIAGLQSASRDALAELAAALESHVATDSLTESLRDAADAQQRMAGASGRSNEANSPPAERRRLANLQRQMARENEQLAAHLDRLADRAAESGKDPQPLRQSADALRQQQVAERMREAAAALEDNHVAQAVAQQQEIAGDLRSLAAGLQSGVSPSDPANLARRAARLADRQERTAAQIAAVVQAQASAAADAARDQREVAGLTEQLGSAVAELPLFEHAVAGAARSMLSAAARLDRDPADRQAVTDALDAQTQLRAIADSLRVTQRPDTAEPPESQPPEDAEAQRPRSPDAAPAIPHATVLLMRSIQQRLRQTTAQLDAIDSAALANDQRMDFHRRRRSVATEQQWLAAELQQLLQPATAPAADTPPDQTNPPQPNPPQGEP